ncbi:MAG: serine hydrolase, partial [Thermomicrobiaceae bacterium]|nr:serine hydrolase [Thermomicrobiaceae bacterium]
TNASSGGAVNRAVERAALERYCGIRVPEPEVVALSAERLERVAGVYRTPHGTTRVGVEDGGLRLEQVSRDPGSGEEVTYPPVRYRPLGALEFVAVEGESEGERIDFIPGDGGIRFLRLHGRLARPAAEP